MVIFLRIRIKFFPTGDVTEKVSILSLSDIDSNGDVSPDLPDLDDWSLDVCREADRRLGNKRSLPSLQKPRPLIKRERSLEQLLKACQIDDDDDFDTAGYVRKHNTILYTLLIEPLKRSKHTLSL